MNHKNSAMDTIVNNEPVDNRGILNAVRCS